jgi:hypothetical protein
VAFLGASGGLEALDVSDPSAPKVIGSASGLGAARCLRLLGSLACVGTDFGLRVLDVSDPARPSVVASFDLPAQANRISVGAGGIQVADFEAGLVLFGPPAAAGQRAPE